MAIVPAEAVDDATTETDPPLDNSSSGNSFFRSFLSFDAPKNLVLHGPSAHFVHLGQVFMLIIIIAANFGTTPWLSESGAQYYFSAASTLPPVESSSTPKLDDVSGDAWRIRSKSGVDSWDVAELEFLAVDDEGNWASAPVAISSGSVSNAEHGSVPGYEPDKAFDNNPQNIWGGRKDAEGQLWIGLQYSVKVKILSVKIMQAQETPHIVSHIALEVQKDGEWHAVEEVSLLAKRGTYEDVFKVEDSDEELAENLVWPSDGADHTNTVMGSSAWTMEQFVSASGHSSLFIPLSYVDQLESFRVCRQPRISLEAHDCTTDNDCKSATGDAMSVCGGDSICVVRSWCALPGRSINVDLNLSVLQYEVIARLKPHGSKEIFSNFKSLSEGGKEVCSSCRFEPKDFLEELMDKELIDKAEDVVSSGLEMEQTFQWQCDESAGDRYGCNVWTGQTVTQRQFSISRSTVPVARGANGEMLRRSVIFYGLNIHFKGEGHMKVLLAYPVLMMICQVVMLLAIISSGCFSLLFSGGHPNLTAFEPYSESLHDALWHVVKLKKANNPELRGLTNYRLQQRLKEDVEVLCGGIAFNDRNHQEKVRRCLNAMMKNNGSAVDAAKELDLDDVTLQNITQEVQVGHPHVKATMDKVSHDSTSEASKEGSDYSQETV